MNINFKKLKPRQGQVAAVSVSRQKGVRKNNVACAVLKKAFGLLGDAHAGDGHRQVSLLAAESVEKMRQKGLRVSAGDFAENITTSGIDLLSLEIGDRLKIGPDAILEISQIGKECRRRCHIYYQAGDCVMPKEGVFAQVIEGGTIKLLDVIMLVT